jgi:hypothetical protein
MEVEGSREREPSGALAGLLEEVERWRANRESPRSRVPEDLWRRAVDVARGSDGLWKTSKVLRFNYEDLRKRVGSAPIVRRPTEFVEVSATTAMSRACGMGGVVVELFGTHNDRMRIEADARSVDVAGLVRAFWSREK